jgi:hypothetical protein
VDVLALVTQWHEQRFAVLQHERAKCLLRHARTGAPLPARELAFANPQRPPPRPPPEPRATPRFVRRSRCASVRLSRTQPVR